MTGEVRAQLVDASSGVRRALLLDLPADASGQDLAVALSSFGEGQLFVDGAAVSRSDRPDDLHLLQGSSLSFGAPSESPRQSAQQGYELRVVSGRGAGLRFAVGAGRFVIGRAPGSDVRLPDPEVSSQHAALELAADGTASLTDLDSTNGTLLEGVRLQSTRKLVPGAQFLVGSTLVEFVQFEVEPLPHERRGSVIELSRRFRPKLPDWNDSITYPKAVDTEEPQLSSPANLALTIAPAVVLAVVALLMGRPEMLIFCAASPLVGIGRWWIQRRQWRTQNLASAQKYRNALERADHALRTSRAAELETLRLLSPDLAELDAHVKVPGRRLWERDGADMDFLSLRLGVASVPSSVRIERAEESNDTESTIWRAPVNVDLRRVGCLGVVGPEPTIRQLGAAGVLHLAARNSPSQLRLVVITANGAEEDWGWCQWLPHCRHLPDEPTALIGNTDASRSTRLKELRDLIRARTQQVQARDGRLLLPSVVVVLDGASELVRQGFGELLIDGPPVGVHTICLDSDQIPSQCKASVVVGDYIDQCRYEHLGETTIVELQIDLPPASVVESMARALAPLRPVNEAGRSTVLAGDLRLLDILGMDAPSSDMVLSRWAQMPPTARAVVGASVEGPLEIDLPRHGPHALLAGMTRSGKSEFVKTLVASLALTHHPDDLSFLFIDFKKGDDYRVLQRLPHTVGLVTSRDLEDFQRTIRLLSSEISRRSDLFGEAQATTIEAYSTARATQHGLPPIARLVVVADEFAELASRAPDQLEELVSVARTGAAFGVHLVLATQLPSRSSVTPQIDANVGLRVSFRSADPEGSTLVVGVPDAHFIAERDRGRGYLKGQGRPLVEFQSGRVGGSRGGVSEAPAAAARLVLWHEFGMAKEEQRSAEVPDPETDLWVVATACRAAAERQGWKANAVPWPSSLPAVVHLDDLEAIDPDDSSVPVLLVDDVRNQRHATGGLSRDDGVFVVAGSPRSGRTTALRSAAVASALRLSSDQNQMYLLDFAGGGLRPLTRLPHCVGSAFDDWEQAIRLTRQLSEVINQRLDHFAEHGLAGIADQRQRAETSAEAPLPYLTLLIDGWDVVVDEGARFGLAEQLTHLLARGQAAGLHAVVAGDRAVTSGRMGRLARHRLVLRCNDANGYAACGVDHRSVPSDMPPGRGVLLPEHVIAHVAFPARGSSEGQASALVELSERLAHNERQLGIAAPERIEPLPKVVYLKALLDSQTPPEGGVQALLGVSSEDRCMRWVDLNTTTRSMFVIGPPRSGRTSALLSIAACLRGAGKSFLVVTDAPDHFDAAIGEQIGITAGAFTGAQTAPLTDGLDALLLDDADAIPAGHEGLLALLSGSGGPAVIASMGRAAGIESPSGWISSLRRSKTGLLLSPASKFDGSVFGGRLSEEMVFSGPPGRAVAGHAGTVEVVQVPLFDA